jgi:hypothetical protein
LYQGSQVCMQCNKPLFGPSVPGYLCQLCAREFLESHPDCVLGDLDSLAVCSICGAAAVMGDEENLTCKPCSAAAKTGT